MTAPSHPTYCRAPRLAPCPRSRIHSLSLTCPRCCPLGSSLGRRRVSLGPAWRVLCCERRSRAVSRSHGEASRDGFQAWRDTGAHGLRPLVLAVGRTWQGWCFRWGSPSFTRFSGASARPSHHVTHEDPKDMHGSKTATGRKDPAGAGCWKCQEGIPGSHSLPALCCTLTFRFYTIKRHKAHSFQGFS